MVKSSTTTKELTPDSADYLMRSASRMDCQSDEICIENGLSVIEKPKGKTPRQLHFAEKNGEPTKYNLMREAIDKAISLSIDTSRYFFPLVFLS